MICTDRGRGHGTFPSWGRKKREIENQHENKTKSEHKVEDAELRDEDEERHDLESLESKVVEGSLSPVSNDSENKTDANGNTVPEEEVHELFRVYLSRAEIPPAEVPEAQASAARESFKGFGDDVMEEFKLSGRSRVCVSYSSYYMLVTAITLLIILVMAMALAALFVLKKSRMPVSFLLNRKTG